MSIRSPAGFRALLVLFGTCGLLLRPAQAQDKPAAPRMEFSEPNSGEVLTNMGHLTDTRDGRSRLERELKKSYKGFSLNDSMSGDSTEPIRPPRAVRSPAATKRLQEEMERRKEWIFMRPEDFTAAPTAEEMLHMPEFGADGQEKKKLTPLERFFDTFGPQSTAEKNLKRAKQNDPLAARKDKPGLESLGPDDEDPNLPSGVRETEKKLRGLLVDGFGENRVSPEQGHRTLSDIFGLGNDQPLTPDQIRAHQEYMKRYQELLPGAATQDPGSTLAGSLDPARAGLAPPGGLMSTFGPSKPSGYDPNIGIVNPTFTPGSPSELNARILNQWNPLYTYTPPEPEKPPPAFVPITQFPRRKF